MEQTRSNNRKVLSGVVIGSHPKTIKVQVEYYKAHPLYGKRFKFSEKYQVHDEKNEAVVGDVVSIVETRKMSKTKTFRLLKIKEHAKGKE